MPEQQPSQEEHPYNKIPKQKLQEDLQRVANLVGEPVTLNEYREQGQHTHHPFVSRYGSWNKAKEALGFETIEQGQGGALPEGKLLNDLRRVGEIVDGVVTHEKYREHGNFTPATYQNRFGGLNKAKEKIGMEQLDTGEKPVPEDTLEFLEDYFSDKRGRFKLKQLRRVMRESGYVYMKKHIPAYMESLNDRDNGLKIHRSTTGGSETKFFVKNMNVPRYQEYYDVLPEETHEVFDQLMKDGSGRSPQGITAGILYLYDKDVTQREVMEMEGVTASEVTVRNCYQYIEETGYGKAVLDKLDEEEE